MRTPLLAVLAAAGLALAPALALHPASQQEPAAVLDLAGLKALVTGMSHECRDISETKFEVTLTEDTFDVPIAFEVSGSGRYVWLTAFLGKVAEEGLPAEQANALLRQNQSIQPAHFFLTGNSSLMIGIALENRALDAAMLQRVMTKLTGDVVSTADDWALPALEEVEEAETAGEDQ